MVVNRSLIVICHNPGATSSLADFYFERSLISEITSGFRRTWLSFSVPSLADQAESFHLAI